MMRRILLLTPHSLTRTVGIPWFEKLNGQKSTKFAERKYTNHKNSKISQIPELEYATQDMAMVVKRQKTSTVARRKTRIPRRVPRFLGLAQTKTGVPGRLNITHRYTETLRRTIGAGILDVVDFRANGMYDPYITGAGHQPYFFDQISALYSHFTVLRSRIKVMIVPVVASAGCQSLRCCLCLNPAAGGSSNMNAAIENPRSNWVLLSHLSNTFGPQNRLSLSWDAKKIFGANALDDPNLSGTPSSDPSEISVYCIQIQDSQGAGSAAVDMIVTIEYDAQWDEPANVATS